MKIGDKVKIVKGSHRWHFRKGEIVRKAVVDYDWIVKIDSDNSNSRGEIPFWEEELKVINEL